MQFTTILQRIDSDVGRLKALAVTCRYRRTTVELKTLKEPPVVRHPNVSIYDS